METFEYQDVKQQGKKHTITFPTVLTKYNVSDPRVLMKTFLELEKTCVCVCVCVLKSRSLIRVHVCEFLYLLETGTKGCRKHS